MPFLRFIKRKPKAYRSVGPVYRRTPADDTNVAGSFVRTDNGLDFVEEVIRDAISTSILPASTKRDNPIGIATAIWNKPEDKALELVKQWLLLGRSVHGLDCNKTTHLHRAASRGYITVAKLLIAFGAKVDARDVWGNTPLTEAIVRRHIDMATFLLDCVEFKEQPMEACWNADFFSCLWPQKPLMGDALAARLRSYGAPRDVKMALSLLNSNRAVKDKKGLVKWFGGESKFRFLEGKTPLHDLCVSNLCVGNRPLTRIFRTSVNELLFFGCDINARDVFGKTPLHYAAQEHHTTIVKFLLRRPKLSTSILSLEGESALHLACYKSSGRHDYNIEVIKVLLERDPHYVNHYSTITGLNTPLHIAASRLNLGVMRELLQCYEKNHGELAGALGNELLLITAWKALHTSLNQSLVDACRCKRMQEELILYGADIDETLRLFDGPYTKDNGLSWILLLLPEISVVYEGFDKEYQRWMYNSDLPADGGVLGECESGLISQLTSWKYENAKKEGLSRTRRATF